MADRGKPLTADILARYRRMIAAGISKRAIARATRTSKNTVKKYLKTIQIPFVDMAAVDKTS